MGAVAADAYTPRFTCQGCGRRERHQHEPPDGWTSITVGQIGFVGYRCPDCIARKRRRAATYRNMAEIRKLREALKRQA